MNMLDYTHPDKVPPLHIPLDRRSEDYYRMLDELPPSDPYYDPNWALFPYPAWLEGGSAWLQAVRISEDAEQQVRRAQFKGDVRLVVGSNNLDFDYALANALLTLGWHPMVAEVRTL